MLGFLLSEPAAAVLRWISFSAASVLVGVVAFRTIARDVARVSVSSPESERHLLTLVRGSAALVLLAGLGRLAQQSLAFAAVPADAPGVAWTLIRTTWGYAWSAQLLGVLWLWFRPVQITRQSRRRVATALVVSIAGAPAFMGHANSAPKLTVPAVLADIAHLLAAGVWIGTLVVMVVVALPGADGESAGALVRVFSPWALTGASTLGATGLFASWLHVREWPLLWGSPYGRILCLKLILVLIVVGVGAINWKRMAPRLSHPGGVSQLRTAARAELWMAAFVFAVTAILVATPLPNE
ncbi:MAG: copper resistance D family protein [Gemmatimonadaceae bacterium]